MAYSFFLKRINDSKATELNLESYFDCLYLSLSNTQPKEIKNVVIEEFAESSVSNIYIPPLDERAYKNNECVLSLLFKEDDVASKAERLFDYIGGQLISFRDNFRNRTTHLIPMKYTISKEKLYRGKSNYQAVQITCTQVKIEL